jgi:2'-hydroxyisoflavone reductase
MSGRRDFLKVSAVLGGALGGGLLSTRLFDSRAVAMAPKPLRILILGGTGFIGPHQVRYALARGHRVTLFNRGRTNVGMFTGDTNLELLLGDREPKPGNYEALKGREWDAVIDNPARRPRWVREAAAAVKGHAKQYVFISTISVYAGNDTPGADETAAVSTTDTPDIENGETFVQLYGPLKALCEREAEKRLDRRRRRPNRPVQLLAGAHRTRRRGAGAAGGRSGAVHRRARCGRVDDPVR